LKAEILKNDYNEKVDHDERRSRLDVAIKEMKTREEKIKKTIESGK
jgi:hypothetical protein